MREEAVYKVTPINLELPPKFFYNEYLVASCVLGLVAHQLGNLGDIARETGNCH